MAGTASSSTRVRTAVVVVHGMGEQLPLETLNRFVKTALPKTTTPADDQPRRRYFSRPERVTDSYEARRLLAYRQPFVGEPLAHGHTEFFEYHWSYKMTGNRLADLLPTFARLLLRKPRSVPYGLKKAWWLIWFLLIVAALVVVGTLVAGVRFESFTLAGVLGTLLGEGVVVTIAVKMLHAAGNKVTASFVDVVRYLDKSPRSYEVRRDIRKGMGELLQGLHDSQRYSRVVVVAHSLGAYIAYDGLTWLWPQICALHQGPPPLGQEQTELAGLRPLQAAARGLAGHPVGMEQLSQAQRNDLDTFRDLQFALWRGMRLQGNPWLVTDLVTVGTPMYFADLLYTHNREEFDQLVKNSELPMCPPRSGDQTVEGLDKDVGSRYGYQNQGREVLTHGAPFAVVRWSNLYFPAEKSWHGDWFGGPLRPLFGTGIVDRPILGNLPGRRAPALAHSRYFSYPDDPAPEGAAQVIQSVLRLTLEAELTDLLTAPRHDPDTSNHPLRG
jgi:hypothetical protein